MNYGEVVPFAELKNDKAQELKPLEEAAEAFGAWQRMRSECNEDCRECEQRCINHGIFIGECADVVQAVTNLLEAAGVEDMRVAMQLCEIKNVERGRCYAR